MNAYYSGRSSLGWAFGRMMKKAVSFVLVSPTSSMYPAGKERILVRLGRAGETGTPAVLASPAASLDDLFDHPARSRSVPSTDRHN